MIVRIDGDGAAQRFHRLGDSSRPQVGSAQTVVGHPAHGAESRRALQVTDRFLERPECEEGEAQVALGFGTPGLELDGTLERAAGGIVLPGSKLVDPKLEQSI